MMALLMGVSGAWATDLTWTSGVTYSGAASGNYTTGWFTMVAPFNGTIKSLTITLGTKSPRFNGYLAISKDCKSTTTGFEEGDFVAISSNTCGTSETSVTMNFSKGDLVGGKTYYCYFVTESAGVYTTANQRYGLVEKNGLMSVGQYNSTTAQATNQVATFSATMTLKSGSYYLMKSVYPRNGEACYIYSNSENENKVWKTQTAPTITQARYVWQATVEGSGVLLKNIGSGHYMSPFTATTLNGSSANYLSATNAGDAVAFTVIDRVAPNYAGYVSLQTQYNSTNTWLNTYTSDNSYVGCHNSNPFAGDQFLFQQVKKVSFSEAVAVNGGSAVSNIYLNANGGDSFSLPTNKLYSINGGSNQYAAAAAAALSSAGTSDITVTVTDNPEVYVTYKLNFGGSAIATKSQYETPSGAPAAATTLFGAAPAYCSYSDPDVATITNETTEVNYSLDWDGPFDFSTDYENAKWYYLKAGDKWACYGASYNSVADRIGMKDNITATQEALQKSMWAFVGNPRDGILILNRHVGDSKYVDSNAKIMKMASSNGYAKWTIVESAADVFKLHNAGYYMYYASVSGYNYLQAYSGQGENENALLTVEAVPYKFLALAFLEEYTASHALGQYFGVDENSYNTLKTTIQGLESLAESDYNSLVSNIGSQLLPRLPESGYYRIKSSGSRGGGTSYITYAQQFMASGSTNKGDGLVTTSNDKMTDYGTIIYLDRVGSSKNYKLSLQGLNVQAHSGDDKLFTATDGIATIFAFNHINLSGTCSIYDGTTHGNLHEAAWYNSTTKTNGVVGWEAGNGTDASSWSLEDATDLTITLNSVGGKSYATFSAPFPVTIGDGAKAYIIETLDIENNRAIYSEIASKQIPAGAGILLISETAASSVTATVNATDFSALEGNDLRGYYLPSTYSAADETNNNLVLGVGADNGTIGFYQMGTGTPSANKAYLPYPKGGGVKGFTLISAEELETGIKDLMPTQKSESIYDLSGRRVSKPTRGLYIKNGQKIAVK